MIDCLILGDSIAKGISDVRKECVAYVKSGINSKDYIKQFPGAHDSKAVIISLGSNDLGDITEESLRTLRSRYPEGQTVYWILPNIKERVRKIVWTIAKEYDDNILDARNYDRSPDHIHPTYKGYKALAKDTK